MSSKKKLADFPDLEAKLQKPSKQSAFEKQKADAEAKRKREAAETAAVYESFVKSFDHDDDDDDAGATADQHNAFGARQQGGYFGREGGRGPPPKRHFGAGLGAPSGLKSGPGSLGPAPTPFVNKRRFETNTNQQGFGRRGADDTRGRLGFHDDDTSDGGRAPKPKGISKVFDTSDDEADPRSRDLAEQKAIAKPTLRLSNLPPVTSPAVIKALMPASLTIENVKILPPSASGTSERKSIAAIVTLSKETPATDIDAAVSSLQNRYLGYGFYLSLHRHLSSAVTSTAVTSSFTSSATSQPFGAKPVPQANGNNPHHPGGFQRGFAPPTSYEPSGGPINRVLLHVPVQAPRDIKQLQLIHKVVESVLAHGPEFEALLMSRPDVQREEKWAWLWDARSEGGVWYRWRLWQVITGGDASAGKRKYIPLFEGSHAWRIPKKDLSYEYATAIDEFVSDPEYNSSDEEDYDDDGQRATDRDDNDEVTYLNPLDKARLTHLLARLPTTLTRIRKGDVARVTTFAITHASRGADEIVDMVVENVVRPFSLTSANPEYSRASKDSEDHGESHNSTPFPEDSGTKPTDIQDTSAASLIGLYVVSDILSAAAASGVRHAWRFRQLFDTSLKDGKVFENLGLMAERLNWGRLRADKWKRSVKLVLSLWEGWCAFPHESQQLFTETFENPPSAKKEEQVDEVAKKNKWKTLETGGSGVVQSETRGFVPLSASTEVRNNDEFRGEDDKVDGEVMDEYMSMDEEDLDTDIDGVPMDDSEDGEPMDETGLGLAEPDKSGKSSEIRNEENERRQGGEDIGNPETSGSSKEQAAAAQQPRRRMRAVDMFADSDNSDNGT
ncbi:uncharacterized protein F4807DRAFT_429938 [Annulohypoxylon truncatum]|uniref:uncharacterized protein n=1 Tax=Annulohypoxylon truncatum TaxID=327061 RepID=UPI0020085181|nr:uncharacterized protein F4807DRAFT_429938 [Annulohypoxylon truncatum]KAI1208518.1 hypothetical protein F4807DRAFT_429938 [Annulohypoxylon truncatum]